MATQTLQYTLCQKPGTRHGVFLLVRFTTASLGIGYASEFEDIEVYPIAILKAYACKLLLVLDHLLFLLLSKINFRSCGSFVVFVILFFSLIEDIPLCRY